MTNTISILGSTGSIGRQTLDVAEQLGLRVAALTANSNVERMEAQCRKFRPRLAVMTEETAAKELAIRLAGHVCKGVGRYRCSGRCRRDCRRRIRWLPPWWAWWACRPTLAAIREKKRIALANKETLVCAGERW